MASENSKLQAILESEDSAEALKDLRESIASASDAISALKWIQSELSTLSGMKSQDEATKKLSKLISLLVAIPLIETKTTSASKKNRSRASDDGDNAGSTNTKQEGEVDERKQRKQFTSCWRTVLAQPLTERLLRRILSQADQILAVQFDAVQFCDLLTHAFNRGGHMAALALSGILTLITRHNLDYPNFYTRLYTLLRDEVAKLADNGDDRAGSELVDSVFDARHRRRFIKLLATFLSSAHLPAYLVAAFVKLAARGALFTTDALCAADLLVLVYNVLLAHAECLFLLHNVDTDAGEPSADEHVHTRARMQADTFDWRANDPVKTHALETSLWEVRSLEQHYDDVVRRIAVRFRKSLNNRGELPYPSDKHAESSASDAKRPRRAGIDLDGLDLSVRYNVERDKAACTFSDSRLFTECFAL